jgi:hypothetical protein
MSTLAHHGIIYVPLGYKTTFHLLGDNSEVRGGSAWGAGTFSVSSFISRGSQETKNANNHSRTATALASPPLRSSSSPPPRARPSTRLLPRSTSSDCKVGKKSKTHRPARPLLLQLPLLPATEPPPKRPLHPRNSRLLHNRSPEMRTRAKVLVACRSSAPFHSDTRYF